MRRLEWLLILFMAFLPKVLFAADFPEYPAKAAKEYSGAITIAGLTVGVEPLADPAAQKRYFGANLSEKGFLPVFMVIENGSPGESFILMREDVGTYVGGEQEPTSGEVVSGRSRFGEDYMLLSAITLSIGGMAIASHFMAKATQVRQNVIKKELRSSTLSPSQMNRGFVYVALPPDPAKRRYLRMRVRVTKVGTDQPIDFEFPI